MLPLPPRKGIKVFVLFMFFGEVVFLSLLHARQTFQERQNFTQELNHGRMGIGIWWAMGETGKGVSFGWVVVDVTVIDGVSAVLGVIASQKCEKSKKETKKEPKKGKKGKDEKKETTERRKKGFVK